MFLSFFYLLRQRGLDISPNEWMTLLDGIEKGLHCSSLIGFYQLCRAVLLKSEIEFDRFDQAFTEFFKDVPFNGELPKEFLSWLNTPADDLRRSIEELRAEGGFTDKHMIVSDAAMNPNELHEKQFVWGTGTYMRSSYEWLLLFRKQYPYLIWLNPETIPEKASYWTQTQVELADIFQMFHLSANGLEAGMKCLLVRQ